MEQALYSALVVDDNPVNLYVIEKLIAGYKIKVTTAVSGQDALEKISSMEYDIVFMDYLMPEMNGIEALHSIRNMAGEYYRKVPVVALTANDTAGDRERFFAEGFQEYIQKPMKPAKLEAVLNFFLFQENSAEGENVPVAEETTKNASEEWEERLIADGLDVKTALLYCNGKESYLDILREYCRIESEMEQALELSYDNSDWGNYTISVHGIKSAMRSIGATELSEEAKRLEAAGKEGRIQYISEHHREFLMQYKQLFLKLQADSLLSKGKNEKRVQENKEELQAYEEAVLMDLREEEFCKLIDEMEDAAYALDVERFLELVVRLKKYRYKGVSFQELLELLQRKIQRADYLSAVGAVKQWKQRL